MSTATYVLRPDSLEQRDGRLLLKVGLPWYRSLPWAGVADIRVSIDGREAPVVAVDGRSLSALADREDYWHIQHRAEVLVDADAPDGRAEVELHVDLRIPGPTKPDGSPMDFAFELTRQVTVA